MTDRQRAQKRLQTLMDYGVPHAHRAEAEEVAQRYANDPLAMNLLVEFYSFLPDAAEDWIRELRVLGRREGVALLAVRTGRDTYLYTVSAEHASFEGRAEEGVWDEETAAFFGCEVGKGWSLTASEWEALPEYLPLDMDPDVCPACHVSTGEYHVLGCPVEVCPWCGGQLTRCGCRYERLRRDFLEETDLPRLLRLLEERGRIAYAPEQRPTFLDDGPGIVVDGG